MGSFFVVILGIWFWVGAFSSPYFFAKRTDRTQAPIQRKLVALGYGLAWPYLLVTYFRGKQQVAEERQNAQERILGSADGSVAPPTPPPSGNRQPRIKNPFDN